MKAWPSGTMIGRDHPAALLRAEVDRAAASHGGLVLVTGEPGIGKTTLVTSAADEARRQGALVLGAACWDSASAPGYWPWVQVLRGLRRSPEDWVVARESAEPALRLLLGEVDPTSRLHGPPMMTPTTTSGDGLLPPALGSDGGDAAEREAFALFDSVTAALVAVSQRRPVLVVLDDLHWSDAASVRLLRFAAQHTWFERLLLVGTYRDAEVEAEAHPLGPLLMSLVAKATPITLTGLSRDEVGALMTRTAGREPDSHCVDDVHRRTGGNPFFVEQTARLWHSDGQLAGIPPGVREVVRQRLDRLPVAVVDVLTVAAVLGREFHPAVLAASAGLPPARLDALLDVAVAARLVLSGADGRYAFAHDLVRETLYDGLADGERRVRHAAVVRAVDEHAALAEWLIPADLARHAWLADAQLAAYRRAELLLAAARDAACRLALEESTVHLRRAATVATDPSQRIKIMIELTDRLFHTGGRDEADQILADTAALALTTDEPALLARFALNVHRHRQTNPRIAVDTERLVREAHRRLVGEPGDGAPVRSLEADLITATEALARRVHDDDALAFSLWARHDATWGPGTAAERVALTAEIREVARRGGDQETELWANSLRWVALLELGDPRYQDELTAFVTAARQTGKPRHQMAAAIDAGITSAFRGDFAGAETCFSDLGDLDDWEQPEHNNFLGHHLRWSYLLLKGDFDAADDLVDGLGDGDHPHLALLRGITAAERGDHRAATRIAVDLDAAGTTYPGPVVPLWLRLCAQATVADPGRCAEARQALLPYQGQWLVSLFGCDLSGPVDHWLGVIDAADRRWDDAVARFTAARDAADRMGARPWSLFARVALVEALLARGRPGDASTAATIRATTRDEARELALPQVLAGLAEDAPGGRAAATSTGTPTRPVPTPAAPAYEFRRDGAVWRLTYQGFTAHLPDAKGLHDLRLLLGSPGVDVSAVELLDPAAGPDLVAARRMGGDEVLDGEARNRYRRHLTRLDDEIDRAAARGDEPKVAALDAERSALIAQLRSAAGLAGRTRRLGDEAERARKTVTARIRDTLRRLDERHPPLAAHLRETVSTGAACRYLPAAPVPWRL
ncbi:AAA family ATPase [Micromonospora craniellae]|uniref:ATPase n=1 Tax=Micromonospora craniellae TaxID=2294034 RepID=A0A372FX95_9ACTN|nr:AAA family ATPase [Micromonospora craniellae]QOC93300.1 AAA family ATPase [Micromonospora craniellae]RFS45363.1 ATPase [Micromonospora craniellae]